jgi:hypothetical protein
MAFDFKQDIQVYEGQKQMDAEPGNIMSDIGLVSKSMGDSPVKSAFSFEDDIKQYDQLEKAPATEQTQIKQIKERDAAIKAQEEKNRQMEADIANMPDPNDDVAQHVYRSPDKLIPTSNIEIDYGGRDLSREDLTAVPEGTVGGHCGVYAENVVKLPGGGNWLVGDTIGEKRQSIERYRKAGLAFKPGEDTPMPGNAVIIDPNTKWGHVAVINSINPDGTATLTESNWKWDKRVSHTRKVRLDDPSIVGFIKTQ